jgi:hypothetical protein
LHSVIEARAQTRALVNAAFMGSTLGLALAAAYMGAGFSQAAAERGEVVRVALGPGAGFPGQPVSGNPSADDVGAQLRGAQGVDPDAARIAAVRPSHKRELECLTQAVYFEARGESARGQQAVATVVMNRVKNPNFPNTVCGVVYQGAARHNGCQFSFACDGAAERVVEHIAWDRARKVAARVLSGAVLRDVGSATHYHAIAVDPSWGAQMLRVAQVGLHVFYRFNPHARRPEAVEPPDDGVEFVSAPATAEPTLRLAQALTAPPATPPIDLSVPATISGLKPVEPKLAAPKPVTQKPVAKTVEAVAPAPPAAAKTDASLPTTKPTPTTTAS